MVTLLLPGPLEGQARDVKRLTVGVTAGAGAVQTTGRDSSWDFGPFFGGRLEWGTRRSAAALGVDVQPFRAEGNDAADEFRAIYVLPSLVFGSGGRRVRLGVGLGVFDFAGGRVAESSFSDGAEIGLVAGASGALRIRPVYSVEVGWKRIQNVEGLRANVWTLQLVRSWGL
jgi:hypothetical protein